MNVVAPLGGVYQAGTLSGNPIAMTAGLATLELIQAPGFFERLAEKSEQLTSGLRMRAEQANVSFSTHCVGGMFGFFFTSANPVTGFAQVMNANTDQFNTFFNSMLQQGINLAPSPFESGFISAAHSSEDIEETLRCAEIAFAAL
jgi:glutamate-1-semialdehyde 2,1-aminomutase